MTPEHHVDGTSRFDSPAERLPLAPHRYLATSRGASATRWLCFALASHPGVFVAHGKHSLQSIQQGQFDSERRLDDTVSLALGNVMSDFYRCRSLGDVFEIYGYLKPGAEACGNVHTYCLEELYSRFNPVADLANIRIVNVIRHPVTFIASHTAMARSAQRYPELSSPLQIGFQLALERFPELRLLEHNDPVGFEAFVISCYSCATWVADLRNRTVSHVKMEDVTSDVDRLAWFCEYLTQLSYDRETLAGFVRGGPINRHRKGSDRVSPHDVYGQWQAWQRQAAAIILPDELLDQFAAEGYDVAMLREENRRTASQIRVHRPESTDVSTAHAVLPADFASSIRPPVLLEQGYRGFNIVRHRNYCIAVEQALGVIDLTQVDENWFARHVRADSVFLGESLPGVKRKVDQALRTGLSRRHSA